ncbi:MAG: MGMT family protein [Planctomycetes bacterium]|nr:MGMT family protein [Planctomycetota bacterium]
MAKARKSWREKLAESKDLPKTLVIPAPKEVDEVMRQVPRGKLITIEGIRGALARKHGTTMACPMTTGIFAWIAAHAAEEGEAAGEKDVTPWWRTLKTGGELNPKYPGRGKEQRKRLEGEGHVVERGRVKDFEKSLWSPA